MAVLGATMSKQILMAVALMLAGFISVAQAQDSTGGAAAPTGDKKEDKKLDISDLESKYWAPKDTDFSVVQNRTYPKQHKIFFSPQYGVVINDQFSEGTVAGGSINYFFNERYGIQATGFVTDYKLNRAMRDLVNYGGGVQPDYGVLQNYIGLGFNWVPFYAKMSVLGKKIVYFDMAVTPTLGYSGYEQVLDSGNRSKGALTYGFDVSQYFLFSKWIAIRTDIKNQWRPEEVAKSRGVGAGSKLSDKTTHDTFFTVGVMLFW